MMKIYFPLQNKIAFSYLASLVKLNIVSDASMDFLMVGHTGNEVGVN